jgi:hypothetical protein
MGGVPPSRPGTWIEWIELPESENNKSTELAGKSPNTIQNTGVNEAHGMFGSSKMYANVCEKDASGGHDLVPNDLSEHDLV